MKRLPIDPTMPTALKAKLEHSDSPELFRIAQEHWMIYMTFIDKPNSESWQIAKKHRLIWKTLIDSAMRDCQDVANWFLETKKFDEGMRWLYDNAPDCIPRLKMIDVLILAEAEEKEKASVSVP